MHPLARMHAHALTHSLTGLSYLDKSKDPKNPEQKQETRDAFTFGESLVDAVFLGAPEHLELEVGVALRSWGPCCAHALLHTLTRKCAIGCGHVHTCSHNAYM